MARLDLRVDCPGLVVLPAFARTFAHFAGRLGLGRDMLVEVVLARDATMARLHRELFGVPGSTDCIAIPTAFPELAGGPGLLGAFYMGVEEVRRNAARQGQSLARESAFVLAHGLLHLLGWDDADESGRRRMFARQERLVAGVATGGRVAPLFRLPAARGRRGR